MAIEKPTDTVVWATAAASGDVVYPAAGVVASGYLDNEPLPHEEHNAVLQRLGEWTVYANQMFGDDGVNDTLTLGGSTELVPEYSGTFGTGFRVIGSSTGNLYADYTEAFVATRASYAVLTGNDPLALNTDLLISVGDNGELRIGTTDDGTRFDMEFNHTGSGFSYFHTDQLEVREDMEIVGLNNAGTGREDFITFTGIGSGADPRLSGLTGADHNMFYLESGGQDNWVTPHGIWLRGTTFPASLSSLQAQILSQKNLCKAWATITINYNGSGVPSLVFNDEYNIDGTTAAIVASAGATRNVINVNPTDPVPALSSITASAHDFNGTLENPLLVNVHYVSGTNSFRISAYDVVAGTDLLTTIVARANTSVRLYVQVV